MRRVDSLTRSFRLVAALACLGLLPGCFGSLLRGFGGGMTKELAANGVSAPATILEIWDTHWTVNDNPVIGMKVEVEPADRPPFVATIAKTTISLIAIPQFQRGLVIPVRFDPQDPTLVAVDFAGGAPASASSAAASFSSSGNPYRDRYVAAPAVGAVFLPPPATPELYLGSGDNAADAMALFENDYQLIGSSRVVEGSDPGLALEQGTRIGAALVVVYGHFVPPSGVTLEGLPLRPRPSDPAREGERPADARALTIVSGLGRDEQFAAYWSKTRPAILGIVSRPLSAEEQTRLRRGDGIVVDAVAHGSPAAAAGIVAGDVIVAIEGRALPEARAVPAFITSFAGQSVRIELLRNDAALTVTAALNPVSP